VFSAIVGIFGTKALDALSNYEKHRRTARITPDIRPGPDRAQGRAGARLRRWLRQETHQNVRLARLPALVARPGASLGYAHVGLSYIPIAW